MQLRPDETEQPLVASCSQLKGRIGLRFSWRTLWTTLSMFLASSGAQRQHFCGHKKLCLSLPSEHSMNWKALEQNWSRSAQPSAHQHTHKWKLKIYPKIYPEEHWTSEQFVTLCFHLSYTSPPKDCPELHHLPGAPTVTSLNKAFCELRGVPDLAFLDPNTQTTDFRSKHSLVTFSLNLNWLIILKGEEGSTKWKNGKRSL